MEPIDNQRHYVGLLKRIPDELYQEARSCVREGKLLVDTCSKVDALYPNAAPSLRFFSYCLLDISDDELNRYFDRVAADYIATLDCYISGTARSDELVLYIFGRIWPRMPQRLEEHGEAGIRLRRVMCRSFFPYVFASFANHKDVVLAYMGLTDTEKKEVEKKYYGRTLPAMGRKSATKSVVVPADLSVADLQKGVNACLALYKDSRKVPSYKEIVRKASYSIPEELGKKLRIANRNPEARQVLCSIISDSQNGLREEYVKSNEASILHDDRIVVYAKDGGRFASRNIEIAKVHNEEMREDLRQFALSLYQQGDSVEHLVEKVSQMVHFSMWLEQQGQSYAGLSTALLSLYEHHLTYDKKLKERTINSAYYAIRDFCQMLYIHGKIHYIIFPQRHSSVPYQQDEYKIIPEDVQVFLDEHIDECSHAVSLLYRLLFFTCWRFKDAVQMEASTCLIGEDEQYGYIKTRISKTRKAIRKCGIDDVITDAIPISLYHELQQYIEDTEELRKRQETDFVFFATTMKNATITLNWYKTAINRLMEKYNFTAIDRSYKNFSASQTRTTSASMLIEAGVEVEALKHKLGHLYLSTTEQYYIRESRRVLAEKDTEFFRREFDNLLGEHRDMYTEAQREALYQDWVIKQRVTYGICGSRTQCQHSTLDACAACPSLVVTPGSLSKWEELLNQSQKALQSMEDSYKNNGVSPDTFSKFEEYRREKQRAEAFGALVQHLREVGI